MGGLNRLERHWRWWLLLFWLAVAGYFVFDRWAAIQGFALSDTDDNMRIMQVRALIEGQGWYDLRQHRLNPPLGADIHWSRLVDLPIAGLKLAFAPLFGGRTAELIAVTLAPMLPMLIAMMALGVLARRLVAPWAFLIAAVLLLCAASARGMWMPLRIDHHGWQLAMLALALMALTDPKHARGGAILGAATTASLAIGLEMLLYLALAGGATVLRWVWDGAETRRLAAYGVTLAGGCALGFLLFASEANRAPVCDALSPVWLSAMSAAGALAVLLTLRNPPSRAARFMLAALAGIALAVGFALFWPQCLGRLERVPAELDELWLSRVREAMPVYRHGAQTAALIVTPVMAGLIGYALMLWRSRLDMSRLIIWATLAAPALLAAALLMWQTRAAPAAQLLSIPGATALVWVLLTWFHGLRVITARIAGLLAVVTALLFLTGAATGILVRLFPAPVSDYRRSVNVANARCPALAALRPVALQPRGIVLTFVDLGPRLIAVTHHDALAGPYHRNARAIIDVMRAWRGDDANAHATARRYRADYILICPNLSESTLYSTQAPAGFYARLARGEVPDWLAPVDLPAGSPYRMWRVID